MAVHFNISKLPLPEIDRQRAQTLIRNWRAIEAGGHSSREEEEKRSVSIPITNQAVQFVAQVGVGSPATPYSLLVDTASANTWVGADKKYVPSSSSKGTGHEVNVDYGSGRLKGTEYVDTLTLNSDLVIEGQSIGVASKIEGFGNIDGVLGLGPVDLTQHTVAEEDTVPAVLDNLFAQHQISSEIFSLSFEPSTSNAGGAELIFGEPDDSKHLGDITYVPIADVEPASAYWGITQDVHYGVSEISLLKSTTGIVDSATTLTLLATSAFKKYQMLTGAQIDEHTGLLTVTEAQFALMKSVYFNIGGKSFELTPNAQIWPRALNKRIGGKEGQIYLIIADLGMESEAGFDFINGYTFLQRFYSVFDVTNKRVGFATTLATMATSN
ncbi:acid protease [Schizopora paradoxa]|uniref:Acid protease n=1 Tax=Schizopora paradoxa TaxID=27342 RepID=A0A0H2RKX0_9AGAM|nr:acid protease [Schizopora paradoxa]